MKNWETPKVHYFRRYGESLKACEGSRTPQPPLNSNPDYFVDALFFLNKVTFLLSLKLFSKIMLSLHIEPNYATCMQNHFSDISLV